MLEPRRTPRPLQIASVLVCVLTSLTGCGGTVVSGLGTSVAALPNEDLRGPCLYDLQLATAASAAGSGGAGNAAPITQAGVLVIFERGDSSDLYNDTAVQAMAQQFHLAMIFARQCNAASTGDLQPDATAGPGRALFAALSQFGAATGHPELATDAVIPYGFSAAGVLTATLANAYPSRVLGAIPYAAGSAHYDLDTLAVSSGGAHVPTLVLANARDVDSGIQRSYSYFQRGRAKGAPWAFAVQKATAHCCTLTTRDLLIAWVTGLLQTQTTTGANGQTVLNAIPLPAPPTVRFLCSPNGVIDAQHDPNCQFASASILPSTAGGPTASWLPNSAAATAWLAWVTNAGTN